VKLAPAALAAAALLLAAGAARGGEPATPAAPAGPAEPVLHWGQPVELPGPAGDVRYGFRTHGLVPAGGRLVASVCSTNNAQFIVYLREAAGGWSELGAAEGQSVSRWVRDGERLLALCGGQTGLRLVAVDPGAARDARLAPHDVDVPEAAAAGQFGMRRFNTYFQNLDLAAHGGKLVALYLVYEQSGMGQSVRLAVRSSADGGKTWSAAKALAEIPGQRFGAAGTLPLALWSGGARLHAFYGLPVEGKPEPELKHLVSADGGETWKDAPALPAPAEGARLAAVRPAVEGGEVLLLAADAGGKLWLYRSADGGDAWDKPRPIGQAKSGAANQGIPPLQDCALSSEGAVLVFSQGQLQNKQDRDPATGGVTMSFGGSAAALLSRDGGASWAELKFAEGLAGRAVSPRCAALPGGGIEAVFAWTDAKGQELLLLGRSGSPRAPEPESAALREKLAGLVRDLAHADWRERERAAAEIARLGPAALPALRAAAKDADAERSLTAENLLRKLRPQWVRE
jgi:hypothetical protein